MELRTLGRSALRLPPVMFGANVFGWTADEAMSHRLLDTLLDAGLNAIDTADVYSAWVPGHQGGESEAVIGRWLKQRGGRDRVVIATKVGMRMGSGDQGLSRDWILREVDASLRRLQTDYIDLYQAHKDDPNTPFEETLGAFAELVKNGKVRVIGASNYSAARLREALQTSASLGLPRFESLQPLYNLMERHGFEDELQSVCLKEKVGVISYYALAAGFLTGKYRSEADLSKSPRGANLAKYLDARGDRVLGALDMVSARLGVSSAQVAIAWTMTRPAMTAPIVSATNLDQLSEIVAAATLRLDADALAQLEAASAS
jgi:aryl-alcohol dehydrogenase-like predicted oxidoreductase